MYANHDFVHRANCFSHTLSLKCQTVFAITWLRSLSSAQSASWTLVSQSYCLMFLPPTQRWCCSSSIAKLMNGNDHVLCEHNKSFYQEKSGAYMFGSLVPRLSVLQATKSWAGPGNKATCSVQLGHKMLTPTKFAKSNPMNIFRSDLCKSAFLSIPTAQ